MEMSPFPCPDLPHRLRIVSTTVYGGPTHSEIPRPGGVGILVLSPKTAPLVFAGSLGLRGSVHRGRSGREFRVQGEVPKTNVFGNGPNP